MILPGNQKPVLPIILVSLALGWLFDYFFYLKVPGISFTIYICLILTGLWTIARHCRQPLSKSTLILFLPLIFFASMPAIRSSDTLTFFNILTSLAILLLILASATGPSIKDYLIGHYLRVLALPLKVVTAAANAIKSATSFRQSSERTPGYSSWLRGILITLPVLLVFIWLFASADLVFEKHLSRLFNFQVDLDPETVFRTVLVLAVAYALIGAYAYFFRPSHDQTIVPGSIFNFKLGPTESRILFGSLNILFVVFILLQLTYLFGGQANIAAQGFTYSEYARKGFFELVAAAVLAFLLVWNVQKRTTKEGSLHSTWFKALSSFLIVQVIIIMASAFQRLALYEQAYGFTAARFYSHVFIIWLAIVSLLLLYTITRDRNEQFFVYQAVLSAAATLAFLNLFNPDAFIARQNLKRFNAIGKLDTRYLAGLSDDAIPESLKALDIPNEDLRRSFARDMYRQRWANRDSSFYTQWPSANLSRRQADQLLQSRSTQLEANKHYQSQPPS
jgi:hypothetical protein